MVSSLVCLSVMVILGVNREFLPGSEVNIAIPDVPKIYMMYDKYVYCP